MMSRLLLLAALAVGALPTVVMAQLPPLSAAQAAALERAEIVILGEIHDNPAHHAGQAAWIRQIAPRAVVFEMLTPEMAALANAAGRGDLPGLGARIGWEAAGWPDFAIYLPIFEALGEAEIIGAAAPRETVRAAFDQGAAAVFGPEAARFGLADPLPEDQRTLRREMQFNAHCEAMPMEMMDGMIEAQRLRDAQFAAAALDALERTGGPVAVITGNGHARRDWGMPQVLARAAPEIDILSVGYVEAPGARDDPRFDVTIVTDPAPRQDPCAGLTN